jgi:ACS family hexuronate transporter-like MFS transporter
VKIKGLRWWIIALVCGGTIINYLARNTLSVLAPELKVVFGMSSAEYSYVVAAFQIGYTIMQPVCGIIIDLIGLRIAFALFAVLWSIVGCLHAGVSSWMGLAALRGLMGVTEAAAIPAGIKAVSEWFPNREKSVAVGYFNAGTSLGAMIAPMVVAAVSITFGWRMAFVVTGGVGIFWAILWYAFYRSPKDHASITQTELELITEGQSKGDVAFQAKSKKEIFKTRQFWAIAVTRFCAEPAWATFSFWIPMYFAHKHGMDIKQIAIFAWMPFLAADLGGIFGGYLSPVMRKLTSIHLVWTRVIGVCLGALLMIAPALIGFTVSPYTAIALLCVGGFSHQVISGLVNTLATDLFNSKDVATVAGFAGMAAWTASLLFNLAIGGLVDSVGYEPFFGLLGLFDIIGAISLILFLKGVVPFFEEKTLTTQ